MVATAAAATAAFGGKQVQSKERSKAATFKLSLYTKKYPLKKKIERRFLESKKKKEKKLKIISKNQLKILQKKKRQLKR